MAGCRHWNWNSCFLSPLTLDSQHHSPMSTWTYININSDLDSALQPDYVKMMSNLVGQKATGVFGELGILWQAHRTCQSIGMPLVQFVTVTGTLVTTGHSPWKLCRFLILLCLWPILVFHEARAREDWRDRLLP